MTVNNGIHLKEVLMHTSKHLFIALISVVFVLRRGGVASGHGESRTGRPDNHRCYGLLSGWNVENPRR